MALFYLSGGSYKISNFAQIEEQLRPLSEGFTTAIGYFEVLGGLRLLLPAFVKKLRSLVPGVAAALAVEGLALSVLFASHSLELVATNPLMWSLPLALVSGF